jgi:hypothetical protein
VIKCLEGNELRVEEGEGGGGLRELAIVGVGSEMERLSSGIGDNPK